MSEIARKEMQDAARQQRKIECTCKDLLKQTRKQKRERMQRDEDQTWSSC